MKNIKQFICESNDEFTKDNLLAVLCAFATLQDDNKLYSLELKNNHLKPTISEEKAFEMAEILMNQNIWEI